MEKQILIKVEPEFKLLMKVESAKEDISVKELIMKAVKQYVNNKNNN